MNIIRKDAAIQNVDDTFPGTFRVVLSAPTLDRDGDTLLPDEWKQPLPDHITFDFDHGMSVASTVGSGTPSIDDKGQLIVDGTYSSLPRAQEVRTLVNEGHIRTTSVAFMTVPGETKGGKTAKQRELLNGAFVAVPSNREALVLDSKALLKAGARNSQSDQELIDVILQAAAQLGGDVSKLDPDDDGDIDLPGESDDDEKGAKRVTRKSRPLFVGKSIVGSVEALRDRINEALAAAFPGLWPWLRATFLAEDGSGAIVFDLEDPLTHVPSTWMAGYTDDGQAVSFDGQAVPVTVDQVITIPGEQPPATSTDSPQEAAAGAAQAAPAAAKSAPESDDEERKTLAARYRRSAFPTL